MDWMMVGALVVGALFAYFLFTIENPKEDYKKEIILRTEDDCDYEPIYQAFDDCYQNEKEIKNDK